MQNKLLFTPEGKEGKLKISEKFFPHLCEQKKNSSSKFLLKYPHLLCTFHKEICLLKRIAVICFIIVCGKKDCSEGTSCFHWISGHQETNKFGFFGRLESAISTELVVLQTQNNFSSLLQKLFEELTSASWKYSAFSRSWEYIFVLHQKCLLLEMPH